MNARWIPVLLLTSLAARPAVVDAQDVVRASPDETRESVPTPLRPGRDLLGAVEDFGRDFWEVLPTGFDETLSMRLAGVLGVGVVLYTLDDEIQEWLGASDPGAIHRVVRETGDFFEPLGLMGNTNVYYAATSVATYLLRQERLHLAAKELLYSHWIAGFTRKTAGRLVGRRRPNEGADASTFDSGEGASFPSGHTSTIFQVAHVLSHHIDRWPATVALYAMATSVAFQRLDSGAHWASDVWIGAAWGLAVSHAVVAREEEGRWAPTLTPVPGGGLAIGIRLR
jgi:membrane-associated phospholipid phosphatase